MHGISATTRALSALAFCAFASNAFAAEAELKQPQYVLVSFDGAHDNTLWERSRTIAQKSNARFTYFLSCVFLIQKENRKTYHPPHKRAGASNVGFAQDRDEVKTRLQHIWQAHLQGHEIASHGCGHFDGTSWSTADWDNEIKSFRRVVTNAYKDNDVEGEPEGWRNFADREITGFRAPYLASAKPVQDALKANGFRYQASAVTRGPEKPIIDGEFASFGLPLIPEGPSAKPIVAMDYNLYMRHSRGHDDKPKSAIYEERTYQAFRSAFDRQYEGERLPLQIGLHFVLMNDGAYWRAMERFVGEVCTKPDVKCTTYHDYLNSLSATPHLAGNRS